VIHLATVRPGFRVPYCEPPSDMTARFREDMKEARASRDVMLDLAGEVRDRALGRAKSDKIAAERRAMRQYRKTANEAKAEVVRQDDRVLWINVAGLRLDEHLAFAADIFARAVRKAREAYDRDAWMIHAEFDQACRTAWERRAAPRWRGVKWSRPSKIRGCP
jgi:regulator of protease activity HflC (stomatin/prohibitin superfamily)